MTGEYLGASRCYFGEISNDSVVIQGDWHTPQKASIAGSYAMSDFLPSELWNEMAKSGLAISDVLLHALTRPRAENFHAISVQSFASAPFIRGGRWVVALAATDSQPRTWRPDEIELLGTVAARAWPLVEHAREELERTRAQEALRISEERLRLSCRAAGVGAWEWTLATNDVYWSPEYCDIYGLDPSAAPSFEKGLAVVVEEDRQKIEVAVLEAVHSGKEYRSEHRIDHPRKGPRWIQAIGNTVAGEDGAPLRMLGIVRDITDQRKVEDELRESERQLRALADLMPQLVWMAHADAVHRHGPAFRDAVSVAERARRISLVPHARKSRA